ncbi:MAG: SRPBCC domain-containing protein [Planctomycetota bacterium]|nr:SRPBCC domain-containing protein [Planctomycetota bacterium]
MKVQLTSDFPVTDAACRKATGKSLKEWYKAIDSQGDLKSKRREAIHWIYDETGRGKDVWWPTTIWVEYERVNGIVNKKDGRLEGFNPCITKSIAASVPVVFDAFVGESVAKMWFGKKARIKATDGGSFDDGDGHTGKYLRVRSNKDLRFTWIDPKAASETLVDVAIADKGKGKSGITLMHQRIQNRNEADGLRRAWSHAFEVLKGMLEG